MESINKYIDHTILKADATEADIKKICKEAKENSFMAVCVNPVFVPLVAKELEGTDVSVASVVGFPLGANATRVKVFEAQCAIEDGATEIDMVIQVGALKSGNYAVVEDEIRQLVETCKGKALLKVIIETALLDMEEIEKACQLAVNAGADYLKTSTGFSTSGATVDDVKLMKKTVGNKAKIKASGGIRDAKTAREMIEAGADRLGASASVAIMNEIFRKI